MPSRIQTFLFRYERHFENILPYILPMASMIPMYFFLSALGYAGLTLAGLVVATPFAIALCNNIYTLIFNNLFTSRNTSNNNVHNTENWISTTIALVLMSGYTLGFGLGMTALIAFAVPVAIETTSAIVRTISRLFGYGPTPNTNNNRRHRNRPLDNDEPAPDINRMPILNQNYDQQAALSLHGRDNFRLREACHFGQTEVVRLLLQNRLVRANAAILNNQALRFACRGGYTDIVRQLLAIPSVARSAAYNHNEAARLAEGRGHFEIVQLLLNLGVVRDHAIPANANLYFNLREGGPANQMDPREAFIPVSNAQAAQLHNIIFGPRVNEPTHPIFRPMQWQGQQDVDLRTLAGQRENAMNGMNEQQHEAIRLIYGRYQNVLNQRGVEAILNEIQEYLRTQYRRKPIKHHGRTLGLEYDSALTVDQKELYYKNKTHTAYRFLFLHPNPWISPNASFARSHSNGGRSASISEEDKTKIALMWLAATDNNQPIPEGYTRERIKKQFTDILAQIGRAHNWDHRRTAANGMEEEYDDLEGDKPSCSMGVRSRVIQFLMVFLNDRPESRPLSANIIKSKFREDLIAEGENADTLFSKLVAFDKKTLNDFDSAFYELFVTNSGDRTKVSKEQEALLKRVEPSTRAVNAFIEACKTYYGAARITATDQNIEYNQQRFNSYEQYIRAMAQNCLNDFGCDINAKVQALKNPPKKKSPKNNKTESAKSKTLTFSKKPTSTRKTNTEESSADSSPENSDDDSTEVIPKPRKRA